MAPARRDGERRPAVRTDALAGAIAGAVSRLVTQPLDVVKIRLQVQVEGAASAKGPKYTGAGQALAAVCREEGLRGLWRGTVPAQLLSVPYTAVQFATIRLCKDVAGACGVDRERHASAISFGSGAVAGIAATLASYPFDLLRTVLAAQGEPAVYRNMGDAAAATFRKSGVRGLYAGVTPTLVEIVPYAALQFGLYDAFRRQWELMSGGMDADSAAKSFVCGLAAGMLSKAATHPLDVLKKRYQVAGLPRSAKYGQRVSGGVRDLTLSRYAVNMFKREGVQGFYKGLGPSLLKAAPAAGVTLTAFEVVRIAMDSGAETASRVY